MGFFDLFKKKEMKKEVPEHYFTMKNGRIIKTLQEFIDYLPALSDAEFKEHANEKKNDFAVWIEDVFHDTQLAAMAKKAKNLHSLRFLISAYLQNQQTSKFKDSVKFLREKKTKGEGLEKKPAEYFGYLGKDAKGLIMALEAFDKQRFKNYITYKENRKSVLDWINDILGKKITNVQADRDAVVSMLKEQLVRPLQEAYLDLKGDVSKIRKSGKDPLIVDLLLMRIPPKIKMAGTTYDEKDMKEARGMLAEAQKEVVILMGEKKADTFLKGQIKENAPEDKKQAKNITAKFEVAVKDAAAGNEEEKKEKYPEEKTAKNTEKADIHKKKLHTKIVKAAHHIIKKAKGKK